MIKEIVNFVQDLEKNNPGIHQRGIQLKEGLYLFVKIEEGGEASFVHRLPYYDKKTGDDKITKEKVADDNQSLYQRCLALQQVWQSVASSKIFNPNAKIFGVTCSPFALGFNKKNIDGKDIKNKEEQQKKVKEALIQYFDTAKKYLPVKQEALQLEFNWEGDTSPSPSEEKNEAVRGQFNSWFNVFSDYCKHNLFSILESETDYQSVKEGGDFNMFLILDEPDYEHFKSIHDDYFARNIFNKDEFNKENGEGTVMGVPDSLYTYNGKKPYLQHQSSPFNLKYRTTGEEAKVIWQFYGLQKRVLPNPLPIFIDKRELNKEVVALYNEERKATYTEIIKTLFEKHQKDLGGYYLLFFEKGVLVDVDFVANFEYDISNCELKQCECLNINYSDKKTGELVRWEKQGAVHNIFQFQNTLTNRLLGLDLEPDTKAGGKWLKYFGEVEYNPKYMTDIQYNLFLKYRLAFYNYVYKSRRNAITTLMFYDIMSNGIIDDLRHYEWKDKRHTKQYAIKEKILIWFSLYHFFDQHNSNNIDMINLTQQLHDELKTYAKGDAPAMEHIDPKLFAFASGQLIRQILQQSKSDKRSHALLEPFVQKTDVNQFKLAIARAFETYKHEFTLYSGSKRYELDKTMALVMGADDPNINVKDLLPYTLAGYFSDSVFVKDNVGTASENTEN